ncbi:MAG: extracellular solute-binding protein [Rubrivivax sp.]|nr:extracellular solute-binding protein [Rubrivivax sp.]
MTLLRKILITLGVAAAAAGAAAQNVVLYSSNNPEAIANAAAALKKVNPRANVQQVTGGTGTLMKRMAAEAANPGGDIFWSGGFGTLAASQGVMEPYVSPQAKAIAPQFIGPNSAYVGTNVHVMVLMVNERQLKGMAMPKTWSDLMKPEWKGKVVITDPARSGTAFIQVYGLLKQFGRDGLERIARNAVVVQSSGQVFKSVAAGEYPVGITIESSAYEFVAGGQKEIKLVYPSEGTYLGPEGMFIIKGAKNMVQAKQFFDVLLSKEAQETLLRENFRRPTRSDIAVAKLTSMPDLASLKVFPLNLQVATDEYEQLIVMWNLALAKAKQN